MTKQFKNDDNQSSQGTLDEDKSKVTVVLEQTYVEKLSPSKIAREVHKEMQLVKKYAG